jgi:tape measure domain-containing protein
MTERLRIVIDGDGFAAERELKKVRRSVRDLSDEQRRAAGVTRQGAQATEQASRASQRAAARSGAAAAAWGEQSRSLGQLTTAAKGAGLALGAMSTYGVAKAIKDGFAFNASIESSELAMRRFIGTTKETQDYVQDLFDLAKKTPFEFTDLTDASRRLLAFGMDAQRTMKVLTATGDAVAAAGGDPEKIQRVVMAIGQIQTKNKVYAEELLQLTEAGIPAYRILKDELGLTGEQVANIGKEGISAKVGIDALTRGMNDMFKGAAREQSTTWNGMISTMRDSWAQMTGALTQGLFTEAKEWAPVVNRAMDEVGEVWKRDKLSFDDKFDASLAIVDKRLGPLFDEIKDRVADLDLEGAFSDAMEAAIPAVAEAGKDLALAATRGFFDAFREADPLTKAILALVVAKKTGALAAITSYGRNAGQQAAAGMATGIGQADPLATAAGSRRSQWMATAKGVGKGVLGVAVVAGIADALSAADLNDDQRLKRLLATTFQGAFGDDPAPEISAYYSKVSTEIRTKGTPALETAMREQRSRLERLRDTLGGVLGPGLSGTLGMGSGEDFGGLTKAQQAQARALATMSDRVKRFNRENRVEIRVDDAVSRESLDRVQVQFDLLRDKAGGSLKSIRAQTTRNMRVIASTLGTESAAGKTALSKNFDLAEQAIRRSMKDGTVTTMDGLAAIRKLMTEELDTVYGMTPREARQATKNALKDSMSGLKINPVKRAGGGWVGAPGERGRDEVPIVVGRGEAVLNHHQQRVVNSALAETGRGHLGKLFQHVKTPHYLAEGGYAGMPGYAGGGVVEAGRRLQAMDYHVAGHSRFGGAKPGVHTPTSYHYKDLAVDVNADHWPGGEGPALDKAQSWLRKEYAGQILELLWRSAGHHDHLHVAIGGAGTGKTGGAMPGGGGVAPTIKRIASGAREMLGGVSQGALDMVRAAAQENLNRAFEQSGGGLGGETAEPDYKDSGGSLEGNGSDLMRRMSRERGWNFAHWWELDRRESSHGKNLANPTSSARLRGQFLDFNWGRYGPGSDPRQNPSMAQQIQAMARYIGERYGNPSKALAHHDANNWYESGGFVDGLFAAAGQPGDAKRSPSLGRSAPVVSGPAKGRKQPTTGSQKFPWKPKGLSLTGKLANTLPQQDQLFNLQAVIDALGGSASRLGDQFDLTDENATRTIAVSQLGDGQLRSLGLTDAQIGQLRADPDQAVEVLNQGQFSDGRGITEHVAELTALIDRKKAIGGHIGTKQMVADGLVGAIQAAIAERKERMAEIAERIRAVRARIQRSTAEIRSTQADLTREEKKKKPNKGTLKSLKGKLSDLRDERAHLIGHRTLDGADDPSSGSMLGVALKYRDTTRDGLRAYEEKLPEAQQTAAGVPAELYEQVTQPISLMAKEIGSWLNTAAPKINVPDSSADSDRSGTADEIARLKASLYDEAQKARLASEAQFGVFRGFAPLAAQRMLGSFARGVANVPHDGMAMLHAGETVVPNPQGPFQITARDMAGGGAPVNVQLTVTGDAAPLIRMVDARVDGKVARVSEDLGRRQRLFTVAPGGR